MPMGRKRAQLPVDEPHLVEIVTPRTSTATITPAENLLAAISLAEPFSLEIAATRQSRRFLVRTGSEAMHGHVQQQLGAAYPQAELRQVNLDPSLGLDPAYIAVDEQVAACVLTLRGPQYLPIRTFRDVDVDAERAAQADPVLGILGALGDLPPGWRAMSQLVLQPAPDDWCAGYLRLAVEHPLASARAAGNADTSLTSVFLRGGLLVAGLLAYRGYLWYTGGDWLHLVTLVGSVVALVAGLVWLVRRRPRRAIYDPRLVQEKVSRIAYRTQMRLAVVAPATVPTVQVEARLRQVTAAYRQFNLSAGNGLRPGRLRMEGRDLRSLDPLRASGGTPVLNTRELAGLWHLPQATADVPLLERTTARRQLPVPVSVSRGCRIGVSTHQGHAVPVCVTSDLLRRHVLLVAKTRRGKSSLLLRLAQALMEAAHRPAVVLVDPHRDLAREALGLVPAGRERDVVYLNVAEDDYPFGLNLLDTGLGWDRDKAVENTLAVFRREFGSFWGVRMQDAFKFALLTLYEANEAICRNDPQGRHQQYTFLQVPTILTDRPFRRSVLTLVTDPAILGWWHDYFEPLDHRFQLEIVNPVQTKVQAYIGSRAASAIFGQPVSTVDPSAWLRSGSIVIVNTAKGVVGEETAALVGGTLINLVGLVVGEQASLDPKARRSVALVIDEFHTVHGADYEGILSELAKYGASLILATQSLARLESIDAEQGKALRATLFANLDGLFAFQTSAEDAQYLIKELGGQLREDDLVELGDFQCYAKLSAAGERLPVFSVRLDPPPASDPHLRDHLTAESAAQYGRDREDVDADLRAARARIALTHEAVNRLGEDGHQRQSPSSHITGRGQDVPQGKTSSRNQGRNRDRTTPRRDQSQQDTLLDLSDRESSATAARDATLERRTSDDEGRPI